MIKSNIRTVLPKNAYKDSLNPLDPLPNPPPKKTIQNLNKVQKERGSMRVTCLDQKISTQTTPTRAETWSWIQYEEFTMKSNKDPK